MVLAGAAVAAWATGCGVWGSSEAAVQQTYSTQAQGCQLLVGVERPSDDKLVLLYEFRNLAPQTAMVFSGVARRARSGAVEQASGVVYVERTAAGLVLGQKVIGVPADIDVERPEIPFVRRVDPGERLRERVEMTLPVEEWTPYSGIAGGRAPGAEQAPLDAWFELGFFFAPDPSVAREVETPAGTLLSVYPFDPSKQTILRVGPIAKLPLAAKAEAAPALP